MAENIAKEGPHMLVKAGEENAGIVDIGDGWVVRSRLKATITRQ